MASGGKKGRKSRSGSGSGKKGRKSRSGSGSGSKKGSKSISGSGSKKGSNSGSGENVFPSESYKMYLKQLNDSEGFDVDHYPDLEKYIPSMVSPVPDGAFTREVVARYAKLAVDRYNQRNETAYEFVKVLKATIDMLNAIQYSITFDAKKRYAADAKTFQAKVAGFPSNGTVKLVRLREPPSPAPGVPNPFPQHPSFPHLSSKVTPPSPAPSVPFPQVPIERGRSVNLQEVRRGVSTLSIS